MKFSLVLPPPALAPWVAAGIQVAMESDGAGFEPCHFPALVEGGITVVLEGRLGLLDHGQLLALPRCFLSGPSTAPVTLYRTPKLRCVGLTLHAAATPVLLGDGASSLSDRTAAPEDVWGPAWKPWEDRIASAGNAANGLHTLFDFVRERVASDRHRRRLASALRLQAAAIGELRHAGEASGLTQRQFERVFVSVLGMRPKLFQRIERMEAALREAVAGNRTDAQIALSHGYFDQSHMGRDFRALAGGSPSKLLAGVQQDGSAHWPLVIGASYQPCRFLPSHALLAC